MLKKSYNFVNIDIMFYLISFYKNKERQIKLNKGATAILQGINILYL